jgi:hypothetical protein
MMAAEQESELPNEIRSDSVQDCPFCLYTGTHFMQHLANKHPEYREQYEAKKLRVYRRIDGGGRDG